jgi:DNA-binding CsgD family transcriptional regulator
MVSQHPGEDARGAAPNFASGIETGVTFVAARSLFIEPGTRTMPNGVRETCDTPRVEVRRSSSCTLLDDAAAALAGGRYERCLDLTEPLRTPDDEERARRAMLRARALAGLARFSEALEVLDGATLPRAEASSAALALRALRGMLLVGNGQLEAGRTVLDRALEDAAGAAPEVRAEILFERARAAYVAGELDAAERMVREIDPFPASFGVRATGLRAWIAHHRNEHANAEELARTAIERAAAHVTDVPVQSRLLGMLAVLAVERLDFELWSFVEGHAARFDLGLFSELGHRVHWGRSALYEANGQPEEAIDAARTLSRAAASDAHALIGRCRRASVLHRYGERLAHRDLAASIRRQFEALDLASIREWSAAPLPIEVAETLALMGDGDGAQHALRAQRTLRRLPLSPYAENPVWLAMRVYAEGAVADASGGALLAQRRYRQAFETFRRLGFVRRAMQVALRLLDISGDGVLAAYVDDHARALSSRSWIRAKLASSAVQRSDSALQRLSRAERDVLAYLLDGRSTADIASARGRSPQTTRNTISKLYTAFGVESRSALLREAARCGLVGADGAAIWQAGTGRRNAAG